MLRRYTSNAMAAIWSDAAHYERWRIVELATLAGRVESGVVAASILAAAEATPAPSPQQVEDHESLTRHDVVAFLNAWTGGMDADVASAIHFGLTSSDVVDTAQARALVDATDLILHAAKRLVVLLADRAVEHRATLCVARTHGQPATLDVLGHRLADFAFAADRAIARLSASRAEVAVVNISGPVGTGIELPPSLVKAVANSLGLEVPPTTTQVVFRDSIAAWVADLALMGAICESVATDVRLGQHDGVSELVEALSTGQTGSSAMPHKRNPIAAENITGLARLLRSYVAPAIEDVALWGHRDISHSSVERIILPDASAVCEHVLTSASAILEGLVVDLDVVNANIERSGAVLASGRAQAKLQGRGFRREEAAAAVRDQLRDGSLTEDVDAVKAEVLTSEALADTFNLLADVRARHI